jgi:NAD(P)-dependent dehydrogenase (short-subunit alcohol dehydrogenase family)
MSKVILITGVSSGLGKHTAEYLAQQGYKVYGTTRRSIDPNPLITNLNVDVTDVSSVQRAVDSILQKEGRIDALINNAGMGLSGAIEDYSTEEAHREMDTNFYGTFHTIQAVLPTMRKQGGGMIINISSIGGLMGLPFQGFYAASKFAIEGLSEALRMELKQFNIKIILVNPGDHQTQFTDNRKIIAKAGGNSAYELQLKKTLAIIENDERNGLPPLEVAKKINSILQKKKPCARYVVSSFEQKLAVLLKFILPGSWFSKILEGHYGIKNN